MLDNIILHIGLDKTGSTAIQVACFANRSALLSRSILYPNVWNHGQLGSCFYDDPARYSYNAELGRIDTNLIRAEDRAYLDAMVYEIHHAQARTMVLSSEAFCFMEKEPITKLKDFLLGFSKNISVLMYYREPLSYAVSAMSQRARTGRPLWPNPPIQSIKFVCNNFVEAFGRKNVQVRKFSPEGFPRGDVRFDFFKLLGFHLDEIGKTLLLESVRNNDALSGEAVAIADAIREIHSAQSMSNLQFVEKYAPLLSAIKGSKLKMTKEQADEVIQVAQEHMNYLVDEFGISFSPLSRSEEPMEPAFGSQTIRSLANLIHQLAECKLETPPSLIIQKDNVAKDINSAELLIMDIGSLDSSNFQRGQLVNFEVNIQLLRAIKNMEMGFRVFDVEGICVFVTSTRALGKLHVDVPAGAYRAMYSLIANLPAGEYSFGIFFTERLEEDEMLLAEAEELNAFHLSSQNENVFNACLQIPAEITLLPTSNRIALAN